MKFLVFKDLCKFRFFVNGEEREFWVEVYNIERIRGSIFWGRLLE